MFDASFKRFAYLPRTKDTGKSDNVYSDRSESFGVRLTFRS